MGDQQYLLQSLRALQQFGALQSRQSFEQVPPLTKEEPLLEPGRVLELEGLHVPVRDFGGFDDEEVGSDGAQAPAEQLGCSLLTFGFHSGTSPADGFGADESLAPAVVIPTMPQGSTLVFNIVSTWGDEAFVGLAGIEIFDGRGFPVVLHDVASQVSADPSSINDLPEYACDPRTVDKLFDQVNFTRDDLHVWLAPFTPGRPHTITVDLGCVTELSMIRVWNYNKSRLHSTRGVRDLEILLDGCPIFVGEVRQAPGTLGDPDQACEHILFTQDEGVLAAVEEHDWLPDHLPATAESSDGERDDCEASISRPPTGESVDVMPSPRETADAMQSPRLDAQDIVRPHTSASNLHRVPAVACTGFTLVLHSTWGDPHYLGLTAIEVLGSDLTPLPSESFSLEACPCDLNDLEGIDGDPRVLSNLVDGNCCTAVKDYMWAAPFLQAGAGLGQNVVRIGFNGDVHEVAGMNLWNYNGSEEDACRGVKEFSVYCDDRYMGKFLCRRAPGHTRFDFKQVVLFHQPPCASSVAAQAPVSHALARSPRLCSGRRVQQQYETPLHPCGLVFRLAFLSTWADVHYVGLDAVELIDAAGRPLRPLRVLSNHGSVRDLPGMERDVRTVDNLLRGAPNGTSTHHWLAPFVSQPPNSIELVFDRPTSISCLRFWNYSRTPSRGARDIEVHVDGLLVYQGVLRQSRGRGPDFHEAVLFTAAADIVDRERGSIYLPTLEELVTFYDDEGPLQRAETDISPALLERPMTALMC